MRLINDYLRPIEVAMIPSVVTHSGDTCIDARVPHGSHTVFRFFQINGRLDGAVAASKSHRTESIYKQPSRMH